MRSMMKKTTIREIKQSLGRYLAIFAIVALGVVMFAGLKVCKESMVHTGDVYLSDTNFFDYRLLSTIGFKQEDIETIAEFENIRAICGSVSVDVLQMMEDGSERVVAAHTLLSEINCPVVTEGRLPQSPSECVLDSETYSKEMIGKRFVISEGNLTDTKDLFMYDSYTVVGLVASPYYLNYERGNTSIGNGVVSGFAYFLREAFDSEYDTEVFITMNTDEEIYSQTYKDYIKKHTDLLKERTAEAINERFDVIVADATGEIADARKELEEKVADAEKELADALLQITDAETEVSEAKKEIESGEKVIAAAYVSIAEKESEITTAKADIQSGKEQLTTGISELEAGIAQLDANILSLSQIPDPVYQIQAEGLKTTKAEYEATLQGLYGQLTELEAGEKNIEKAEKEIEAAKKELASKELEIADAKTDIEDAEKEIADGYVDYNKGVNDLAKEVADAEAEISDAEKELEELESPLVYVLDRDTNVGYACFESDSSIVEEISAVFPIFFFAVAVLVCMTTMTRMVEDQRTQIGVLKALGYSEGTIMGKYLFYAGSAAAGGAVFGFIVGTLLFPKVIWIAYGMMYGFSSEIIYVFDPVLALISFIAALFCSLGATYFSCASQLLSVPASLIRPKAPKSGKRIFLEHIGFIWKRLKFLQKVSIRNVFRYKKRFIMMVLGISGCTALLVTALGLNDSIKRVVTDQYDEISTYELAITLADEIEEENQAEFENKLSGYVESYVFLDMTSKDIQSENGMKSAYVVIPKDSDALQSKFALMDDRSGEMLSYPGDGEAILTKKLARKLGVSIGDTVVINDSDMNKISVTVSGICKNYVYSYIFITKETYQMTMKKEPQYKSLYADFRSGVDEHALAAKISDMDEVTTATVTSDVKDRFTKMMSSLDYVIIMVVVCAAALAFIVLYNLTNINITERIREIATIKVLGFYPNETASYVFRENMILTFFGALLGLILGKWLHLFVMNQIDIDVVSFEAKISHFSFLASIVLTFVFAGLVNWVMYYKLEKINMAESLKSIE